LKQTADQFPDFVRYAVQQLKAVCPAMGKAKYPNHLWHVDLTIVPILGGLWASGGNIGNIGVRAHFVIRQTLLLTKCALTP
jgi:hypothetical protein